MTSPLDVIKLAQKISGAFNDQEPSAADTQDALFLMNTLLSEWQLFRYLVTDLVMASKTQTGTSASFTVGPAADFIFSIRPDKIDAAYITISASSPAQDQMLYPFMSREGFDRMTPKAVQGTPIAYFYDSTLTGTTGTISFFPAPASGTGLHIQAKAFLGQFSSLTQAITLPPQYITALLWNLAGQLRPFYGLPADPQIIQRAAATLATLANSVAQVPQNVVPTQGNRAGIYSSMLPGGSQ